MYDPNLTQLVGTILGIQITAFLQHVSHERDKSPLFDFFLQQQFAIDDYFMQELLNSIFGQTTF
jgi:hypothetical protein